MNHRKTQFQSRQHSTCSRISSPSNTKSHYSLTQPGNNDSCCAGDGFIQQWVSSPGLLHGPFSSRIWVKLRERETRSKMLKHLSGLSFISAGFGLIQLHKKQPGTEASILLIVVRCGRHGNRVLVTGLTDVSVIILANVSMPSSFTRHVQWLCFTKINQMQ